MWSGTAFTATLPQLLPQLSPRGHQGLLGKSVLPGLLDLPRLLGKSVLPDPPDPPRLPEKPVLPVLPDLPGLLGLLEKPGLLGLPGKPALLGKPGLPGKPVLPGLLARPAPLPGTAGLSGNPTNRESVDHDDVGSIGLFPIALSGSGRRARIECLRQRGFAASTDGVDLHLFDD